ncbi:MAG: PspC domain-containing protein [Asgard group archaeon]|nr:PspC domain-containing protein [Asgard group archaeon]
MTNQKFDEKRNIQQKISKIKETLTKESEKQDLSTIFGNLREKQESQILFRSKDDYLITGVIGEFANYWNFNSTILRVIFIFMSLLTGGIMIIVYVILTKIIPEQPQRTIKSDD